MIRTTLILLLMLLAGAPLSGQTGSQTVRIKDIVSYKGAGVNLLTGQGLVIGLNGTGDKNNKQAAARAKALSEAKEDHKILENMKAADFASDNIAWVTIQAEITESHTVAGKRFRATVAIGDGSSSLTGGLLVMSILTFGHVDDDTKGTIAIAGGKLHTGVPSAGGNAGRQTAATTATVECTLMQDLPEVTFFETVTDIENNVTKSMTLILHNPDAKTAQAIAQAINDSAPRLGNSRVARADMARATGIDRVEVTIPRDYHGRELEFRSHIESESVNPDLVAKVNINTRDMTIIVSGNVRVLPCMVSVAGVSVATNPQGDVPTKPAPGAEVTDPVTPINQPATPLLEIFAVLDALGMTTSDKIKVIESMATQGALQGAIYYD
jgi:flagellar P-ring protein precursor FlgI